MSDLISRKEVAEILNHQRFGIAQISWDIISEKIKALPPVEPQISKAELKDKMLKYGFTAPDMTVTEFVEDFETL